MPTLEAASYEIHPLDTGLSVGQEAVGGKDKKKPYINQTHSMETLGPACITKVDCLYGAQNRQAHTCAWHSLYSHAEIEYSQYTY